MLDRKTETKEFKMTEWDTFSNFGFVLLNGEPPTKSLSS